MQESGNYFIGQDVKDVRGAGYFTRNRPWLFPLLCALLLCVPMPLIEAAGETYLIPSWVVKAGLGFAIFLIGIGATITDTVSARIVMGAVWGGFGAIALMYVTSLFG